MKKKNYKTRSKVFGSLGTATTFFSTLGGFVVYESIIDWQNFKTELQDFVVIEPESVKLNLLIAFPLLIALLVFVWVYSKKNKEKYKGKISLKLLFVIILLWLIYSTIAAVLFALMGAFAGSLVDEVVFEPLEARALKLSNEDHEIEMEVKKERVRKKVRDEIDGTV